MLTSLLILLIGLTPSLLSLWMRRYFDARAQERLRLAMESVSYVGLSSMGTSMGTSADHHYVEGIGFMIGDLTCQFNARSSYLRCAINPSGPCQECPHYRSIE